MSTVLVVDAMEVSRDYLATLLEEAGYGVEVAVNGVEALEKVFTHSYALLMVDINLPKMDGLHLIRHIRQQGSLRDLPVLLMSAVPRPGEKEAAMRAGANLFRGKPLSPADVVGLCHLLVNAVSRPKSSGIIS